MRAIMIMFDSLNRRFLPPYGCDWTKMPNFARLAGRTVTMASSFVGSMPCMPARRELHTGRYNFLHRSWGPLEPFDDSMPAILGRAGIYTHLISDHYHYWEDGGCTYHTKYNTWDCVRGHEGDPWIGQVKDPEIPPGNPDRNKAIVNRYHNNWRQDWINRAHMPGVEDHPLHKSFMLGLEFIERNQGEDNWFLHLETFAPHEPYFTHQQYKDLYPHSYNGPHFDWPPYRKVSEDAETVQHMRYESAAYHSMCDDYLGRVLDLMDAKNMWGDTMLIVNTDHGFLLAEHDLWAKGHCPMYNEIAHTPLFIWDPRVGKQNELRHSLVQTIDLPATLLEFFGRELPPDMQGRPLRQVLENDSPVRAAGLFGIHGAQVNVTDGRFVYMRGPQGDTNAPLFNYTVMPTAMREPFHPEVLRHATLAAPFAFTKNCPTLKIPCPGANDPKYMLDAAGKRRDIFNTFLFDLQTDPGQQMPIHDTAVERRMCGLLKELMLANDAPPEQFERLGL